MVSKKIKKAFAKIQSDFFPPKIRWSQKKKVFTTIDTDILSNFANSDVWGGAVFEWGGLFSIFHIKSASKAQKTCDFAYFTSQWGGLEPPAPPPPGYATAQEYNFKIAVRRIVVAVLPNSFSCHRTASEARPATRGGSGGISYPAPGLERAKRSYKFTHYMRSVKYLN